MRGEDSEVGFTIAEVLVAFAVASLGALLALEIAGSTATGVRRLESARASLDEAEGVALRHIAAGPLRPGLTQGVFSDGIAQLIADDLRVGRTYRVAGLGLPEDGSTVACSLGRGRTALVGLQDQGRLIDLNTTPRPALEEAFRLLGLPDRTVPALAAEIVDARDPDDVPEPTAGPSAPSTAPAASRRARATARSGRWTRSPASPR